MNTSANELFSGVVPFVTTAQTRSFKQAAALLGLTPSAVSKAISRLERELGIPLFRRSSRNVHLTEEGELFLNSCREAVTGMRAAKSRFTDGAPRGTLKVSAPLILGARVLLPALDRLLARHPGLTIQANLTDRFVPLDEENVDVAVRIGKLPSTGLSVRKLRTIRWLTVAAPSYLARSGTPEAPGDLLRHNCLRFRLPSGLVQGYVFQPSRSESARASAQALEVRGTLTCDHGEALIDAALRGLGLFQAHDYAVAEQLARGELVEVLADHAAPGPSLSLLYAQGRRGSRRVRVFVDFVRELLAPHAAEQTSV